MKSRKAKIILISGINGVGKTTLSFELSKRFQIKQRIGLGTLTKSLELNSKHQSLFSIANNVKDDLTYDILDKQAKVISSSINHIIHYALKDGTDCIIEGVQLNPDYLDMKNISLFVFIKAPKFDMYKERLNNSITHKKRRFSDSLINKLLEIEKIYLNKNNNYKNIIVIQNNSLKHSLKLLTNIILDIYTLQ